METEEVACKVMVIRNLVGRSGACLSRTDVSLLTPETHTNCVSRFIARKMYGSEVEDPFEPAERVLKP